MSNPIKQKFDSEKAFKNIIGIDTPLETRIVEHNTSSTSTTGQENNGFLKIKPQEKKTKRLNLLIKPSLHAKATQKSKIENVSLNDVINQLLEIWTEN